jgi:hypothetical protein
MLENPPNKSYFYGMSRIHGKTRCRNGRWLSLAAACVAGLFLVAHAAPSNNDKAAPVSKNPEKGKAAVQRIIFEEQKIEGKIRRPQMVLIKADQRPGFPPMIMQSAGKNENVASFVDPAVTENSTYQNAFQFQGTTIINYVP